MKPDHEETRPQARRTAAEWYVRLDAHDSDAGRDSCAEDPPGRDEKLESALARCEAAVSLGKALEADPELRWAYDEAKRIAAGPPHRGKAASVRARLASPALAWSIAAAASVVAIVSLATAPGRNDAQPKPDAPAPALRSSDAPGSAPGSAPGFGPGSAPVLAESGTRAAPAFDIQFDAEGTSPVVALPGRVFVDARSVAVMPFVFDRRASATVGTTAAPDGEPRAQVLASALYAAVVQALERIPGIYVAQPASVAPYAGMDLDADQVAAQLGVRGIVAGRLTAEDGRVRVTLSLTDAASDHLIWQGAIERPFDSADGIGVDMAVDIAAALADAAPPFAGTTRY